MSSTDDDYLGFGEGPFGNTDFGGEDDDSDRINEDDEKYGFGGGHFGLFPYGGGPYHDNVDIARENWDHGAIEPRLDDPLYDLVVALVSELYRIDGEIERLFEQRFVDTATGIELDRLGRLVGVERPFGENDDAFRIRVKAGYAKATSTCDFESFAKVALKIIDGQASQLTITNEFDTKPATVIVEAPSSVLSDNPLSNSEIQSFLEDAVPMSHRVELRENGSFQFLEADGTAPSGTGFGQGTWTESV